MTPFFVVVVIHYRDRRHRINQKIDSCVMDTLQAFDEFKNKQQKYMK